MNQNINDILSVIQSQISRDVSLSELRTEEGINITDNEAVKVLTSLLNTGTYDYNASLQDGVISIASKSKIKPSISIDITWRSPYFRMILSGGSA